eukprot:TRINITY_DN23871_c0_g1_i3.p1 TRINITY_DN23871_c0_g1~~TRINITY_DN23871_c0_g1_i3.p1  ORF type:complete len:143 (+),score=24.78 TRINITY_DN23871_c0_g1_i3:246-674(+)
MAYISNDCVIAWGTDFNKAVSVVKLVNDSIEMELEGCTYSASLDVDTGMLRWNDGDTWVRGFQPYVGEWLDSTDGVLVATILQDGRLVWNKDARAVDKLTLKEGSVELKSNSVVHAAKLSASKECGPASLSWDDGDVWILRN